MAELSKAPRPPQSRVTGPRGGKSRTGRVRSGSISRDAIERKENTHAQPGSTSRQSRVKGRPQTARARLERANSSTSKEKTDKAVPFVGFAPAGAGKVETPVPVEEVAVHSDPYSDPGPPPHRAKRELIFDSLQKIVGIQYAQRGTKRIGGRKAASSNAELDATIRGTYMWTTGAGYHGQLGHAIGRGEKRYRTSPALLQDPRITSPIRQIACGGFYTAAVTDDGSVFTWGDGRFDQLGHRLDSFSHQRLPGKVGLPVGVRIMKVACGEEHTMAIDRHGVLYGWGNNRFCQVGTGDHYSVKHARAIKRGRAAPTVDTSPDAVPSAPEPSHTHVLGQEEEDEHQSSHIAPSVNSEDDLSGTIALPKFVDVVCGYNHSAALTEDGVVYAWGHGGQGQLGLGTFAHQSLPVPIAALRGHRIVHVSCGASHSCFVTDKGEVFLCGFGQHLFSADDNFSNLPMHVPIKDKEPVVSGACGQAHVLVLTKGGDVYAWGSGDFGQLGHGSTMSLTSPRCVLLGKDIASVYCGRYHSIALSREGAMYAWGCGENGELGYGKDENVTVPKLVEACLGTVVGYVACGQHHTALLTGAPWKHISPDVWEFCLAERLAFSLKCSKSEVNVTGGITKKDLQRIEGEKREHVQKQKRLRQQSQLEEQRREEADLKSIRRRASLAADAAARHSTEPSAHTHTRTSRGSVGHKQKAPVFIERPRTSHGIQGLDLESPSLDEEAFVHQSKLARTRPQSARSPFRRGGAAMSSADNSPAKEFHSSVVPFNDRGDREYAGSDASDERADASIAAADLELMYEQDVPGATAVHSGFLRASSALMNRLGIMAMHHGVSGNQTRLKDGHEDLKDVRARYDSLRAELNQKQALLKQLHNTLRLEQPSAQHQHTMQLKEEHLVSLKMKTNTMHLKIQEAEENKKSYELSLAHLKEDQFERYMEITAMKAKHRDNDRFLSKLERQMRAATQKKCAAESELADFRREVDSQRVFLNDQLQNFKAVAKTARHRSTSQRKERKRKAAQSSRHQKTRISKMQEVSAAHQLQLEELKEKMSRVELEEMNCERRYQQLVAATGMRTADEMITKFRLRNELLKELRTEIAETEKRSSVLKAHKKRMEEKLGVLRDEVRDVSWRRVEELQEQNREASFRLQQSKKGHESVVQSLLFVQEGLTSVLSSFPQELRAEEAGGEEQSPTSLLRVLQLVKTLEQRADALASCT